MVRYTRSLIRAALGLSLVLAAAPLAQAQGPLEGVQAVLNQLDNAVPGDQGSILSSRFSATPLNDKIAADDFLIPAGPDWWQVTEVSIIGKMCLDEGSGDVVKVVIYRNDGPNDDGKPGVQELATRVTVQQGSNGSCSSSATASQYDLTPETMIRLRPDRKYWISVHSVMDNSADPILTRRLYWSGRVGLFNQPAFYYTGGSEPSCNQVWVERRVCDSSTTGDDMTWALTYTPVVVTELYVPMVSRQ